MNGTLADTLDRIADEQAAERLNRKGWRVVKLERVGPNRRPVADEDTRPYRITEEL